MAEKPWFYRKDGEAYGPVPWKDLRQLKEDGTILPETELAHSADGPWRKARGVRELFWKDRVEEMLEGVPDDPLVRQEAIRAHKRAKFALGAAWGSLFIAVAAPLPFIGIIALLGTASSYQGAHRVQRKLEELRCPPSSAAMWAKVSAVVVAVLLVVLMIL